MAQTDQNPRPMDELEARRARLRSLRRSVRLTRRVIIAVVVLEVAVAVARFGGVDV